MNDSNSNADVMPLAPADPGSYIVRRSFPVRLLKSVLGSARGIAPGWLYRAFSRVGFAVWKGGVRLLYGRKVLKARLRGDRQELEMSHTVHRAMRFSLVGSSGLEVTYKAVADLLREHVDGSLVECGVAEGGCSALMATVARHDPKKVTWLFDSFEGLPDPTSKDFVESSSTKTGENIRPLEKGSCLGTIDKVKYVVFNRFGIDPSRVRLVQGWFQDTLPAYRDKIGPIAMLRIDGDWYESTKCCLENLFDQVVTNGYCIVDDYGTFYGCRQAVGEFLESRNLKVKAFSDGRGGFVFRKPATAQVLNPANQPVSRNAQASF